MLHASPRVSNGKMPSLPQLRGVSSFKPEICKMSLTVRGACWRSVSWGWCFGRASQRTLPVHSMCWCLSEKQMAFQVGSWNVRTHGRVSFSGGLGRSVTGSFWDHPLMKLKALVLSTALLFVTPALVRAYDSGTVYGPDGITTYTGNCSGGTAYGPDGITTWSGGPRGGTIYGPKGITTYDGNCSGGTAYGPDGITTWSGNRHGGTIYGPDGISTYTRSEFGGTLYGPHGITTWDGSGCPPIIPGGGRKRCDDE